MQQPWFQVFADLPGHIKVGKLRDGLKLKNRYEAVGLIVCIWSWAAVHAPSGELTEVSAQDLADAAGWRKSGKSFVEALVSSGFADRGEDGSLILHDWDDHQGMLQDALARSRAKTAERVRKHRAKKKAEEEALQPPSETPNNTACNAQCNVTGNVTGNGGNGATSTYTNTNTYLSKSVVDSTLPMGVTPDGDGGDRDILKLIGGDVGQGVLLLTDWQMDDLISRMGLDGFDAYAKRLVAWVQRKGAQVDHYREILRWWQEDTAPKGPELLYTGEGGGYAGLG